MIKILTDSVASIPADAAREAGIDVITLYVNRDGRELADADMDLDAFYADIYDMVDNIPTSSQPSQAALEAVFEEAAQAGDEVLGVFISTVAGRLKIILFSGPGCHTSCTAVQISRENSTSVPVKLSGEYSRYRLPGKSFARSFTIRAPSTAICLISSLFM